MSNPRKARAVSAAFFLAGGAALSAALLMPDAGKGFTLQACLGIAGATTAFLAGASLLWSLYELRSQRRLLRGQDLLARWSIPPDRWDAFEHADARWNTERGTHLHNRLNVPRGVRRDPIEIIVAKAAVQVGPDFHSLPRGPSPVIAINFLPPHPLAGGPACLEFALYYPGGEGSEVRAALRFPAAEGPEGQEQATRVVREYRRALADVARAQGPLIGLRATPRWLITFFLVLALLSAAAAGIGLALQHDRTLGQTPALLILLGIGIGIASLVFALTVYVRRRMFREK